MEERAAKKSKKWTIRITVEDGDHDSTTWDASELTGIVLKMISATPELADRYCTRLEIENDDY